MSRVSVSCLLTLVCGLCAAETSEVSATVSLADVDAIYSRAAQITTSAQEYILQKRALQRIAGAPVTATITVDDVKAIKVAGETRFSVEAVRTEPAYRLSFHLSDEDAAFTIDRGETVTLRGTGDGVFFGKNPSVVVVDASVVQADPIAQPEL